MTPALSFPPSDTGSLPPIAGQSRLRSPTASPLISRKKAKWRADSPASEPSSPAEDLTKVSAISPLIGSVVSGLGKHFNPDPADVIANPDLVDLEAAKSIFGYLAHWSSQPETIQSLTSLPQERSLLGAQYEYMQRRFSEISLYPLPPPRLLFLPPPWTPIPSLLPLPLLKRRLPQLLVLLRVAVLMNHLDRLMPPVLARLTLPVDADVLPKRALILFHSSLSKLPLSLGGMSISRIPSLLLLPLPGLLWGNCHQVT